VHRRRFAAVLLCCLDLAGCVAAPPTPGRGVAAIRAAPGCDTAPFTRVPLEPVSGVWSVPVDINGRRVRLILDTGAERTLLTEQAVAALGMARDPQHQTRTFGIGGLSTTADAWVSSFAIGGAYVPVSSVTVGQFTLPNGADAKLDGLLGADILSTFDVDLDLRAGAGVMTLYRARRCPQAGPPWPMAYLSMGAVDLSRDRLLVPIVLDGAAGMATLDTGAQHSAVSDRLAARAGAPPAVTARDPSITAHGASADKLSVPVHRFRLLQIGPTSVTNPLLPVVPIPEGLGDGLAGADFLAGRRVWLSYGSLQVFVTPLGPTPAVVASH
jgi:predicted aspartyl protease